MGILPPILTAVIKKYDLKKFRKENNLTYSEFLFYKFLPEIMILSLAPLRYKKKEHKPHANYEELLRQTLKKLISMSSNITIKKVCSLMGISHETLRCYGLLPIIAEAKKSLVKVEK